MSGYTPAFADMYTGTLYGRWPAAAVWASLLPLFDRNGRLDMGYQAISGMTGWPLDLLKQGIEQLMSPDEGSRSKEFEGRRLIELEPGRGWGWIAVNHGKYAEKARLRDKSMREVESGKNAARLDDRRRPPETAGDRPSPPVTPSLSASPTASPTAEEGREGSRARPGPPRKRCPDDFEVTAGAVQWARVNAPDVDVERETAKFRDCEFRTGHRDWPAVWRNWMRRAQEEQANRVSSGRAPPSAAVTEGRAIAKLQERRYAIGIPSFRDALPGESADHYRQAQEAQCRAIELTRRPPMPAVANLAAQKRMRA